MRSRPSSAWICAAFALAFASVRSADSGTMNSWSTSEDGVHITVRWQFYEYDGHPVAHPEWVGYDLLRRPVVGCGAWVRINPDAFPRIVGVTHDHTFVDTPPELGTAYEYQVVMVDADRHPVFLDVFACDFCVRESWACAPNFSAPLAEGRLFEEGPAFLRVISCQGSCFPEPYLLADDLSPLRAHVGTETTLRFYGEVRCGSVEGCSMGLHHYEVAPCDGVVATQAMGWGRLKLIYR
jgi:hypothetical protein